ncbi:MAG: RDD family protein [Elusimicrobia bacterium]|nr:RDD family protein [Elusimicrobiota bacterium]
MELASRLYRLWAALIDRLLAGALIGAGIFIPSLRSEMRFAAIMACLFLLLALVGVQFWMLSTEGQTIGKKAMGLRIVKVSDLSNGGFSTNVLMRAGLPWVIAAVPIVGTLFWILDPLFIFRENRLCLHDQLAGTCVIKG